MNILNIAGYKFVTLTGLIDFRRELLAKCNALQLKGTILLSTEGINISLAGEYTAIQQFKSYLVNYPQLSDMSFRESHSDFLPFQRMKVKLKKEIITMRRSEVLPEKTKAPEMTPEELKQWLDEKCEMTLLDTRNAYEIEYGTFENAVNLGMEDFCEFPQLAEKLNRNKPIVMFCTGGIRCEKAAVYLLQSGFNNVYQLQGGILNYFSKVGGAHYQGNCFVFDERVAVDTNLKTIN